MRGRAGATIPTHTVSAWVRCREWQGHVPALQDPLGPHVAQQHALAAPEWRSLTKDGACAREPSVQRVLLPSADAPDLMHPRLMHWCRAVPAVLRQAQAVHGGASVLARDGWQHLWEAVNGGGV